MTSKNDLQAFFIVSNLEVVDTMLKYFRYSKKNKTSLDLIERLSIKKYNKEGVEYIIKVFSFSFEESKSKEKETEIHLNGFDNEFIGKIKFTPKKNNFIYDISFDISSKDGTDAIPEHLNLSKCQQFNIFIELFKDINFKDDEKLFNSLLNDSFNILKEDYYYVDFYLSLLANSYSNKNIIELLSYFNLKKIKLSEKIDKNNFSTVLNKIKISPDLITKYLKAKDSEIEKNLEIFYVILLYYRLNYEENNVNELFEDHSIIKYYRKILFSNKDYFIKICLSNSFIDEIIQTDFEMNYDNLLLILNYLKNLEKILIFLNKYSEQIFKVFQTKEKEESLRENKCDVIKLI